MLPCFKTEMHSNHNLNPSLEPLSEDEDSEEAAATARRQEAKTFTIILVCVLQKSALPRPFVGRPTGGGVKQTKKADFLLHCNALCANKTANFSPRRVAQFIH